MASAPRTGNLGFFLVLESLMIQASHSGGKNMLIETMLGLSLVLALPVSLRAQQSPELWVGIELGGNSAKATVLAIDSNGISKRPKDNKEVQTNILTGMVRGNAGAHLADDAIERTAKAVTDLREYMQQKHNVPDDHIYVVASSGVQSNANAASLKRLSDKVRSHPLITSKHRGFVLNA
jgi:hypothetical protein